MLKSLSKLRFVPKCTQMAKRSVVSAQEVRRPANESSMCCWQLSSYADTITESTVTLNTECPKPVIQKPTEMLIQVLSSSINPIDIAMCLGYGKSLLPVLQISKDCGIDAITYDRLPLVLGRDFCGQVLDCGQRVSDYKIGDIVWGALPPFTRNGSHSELIVADQSYLSLKPSNLSAEDSAAIPYAGLTAWAAIHTVGRLNQSNAFNKRVLVLGGSGGVGTLAIQLLKSWGAYVTTTCAKDATDFVYETTDADLCVDYETNDLDLYLESFDFVLNAASPTGHKDLAPDRALKYLRKWKAATYVTLTSPVLANTDRLGLLAGTGLSALSAAQQTIRGATEGQCVRWAFYWPDSYGLKSIARLVEDNQIKAVIGKRFKFNDLANAYVDASKGHARGKTVIQF